MAQHPSSFHVQLLSYRSVTHVIVSYNGLATYPLDDVVVQTSSVARLFSEVILWKSNEGFQPSIHWGSFNSNVAFRLPSSVILKVVHVLLRSTFS